jgi:predicted metal-binding protein
MENNYLQIFKTTAVSGLSAHEWAKIKSNKLSFLPQLLDYCKANTCGKYNKSWACPPACGSMEDQRERIKSSEDILVFTTKHKLEDPFDHEGMTQGREQHTLLAQELRKKFDNAPVFGAGACPVCAVCAFPAPCLFPEKMIGSVEAAGIDVTELSKTAGVAYNNGPNTVTYFSIILLK